MIPRRIEEITVADLSALISEARSEDRTIEYKQSLPSSAESERVPRLLKPVCSFANTDGGDLVFGVSAAQGIPTVLKGVDVDNIDQTKLSIEHIIQSGIEPQIRGVNIRDIQLDNGNVIFVIRVPKSWIAPHRVKGNARFYARNSAGTYELDVPQIRQSFLLTDTLSQRIGDFRASRVAGIVGEGAPVRLQDGLRVVLHLIPISAFATQQQISIQNHHDLYLKMLPAAGGNINYHLNFDGLVVASGIDRNAFRAYTQLFRSGVLEFVRVYEVEGDMKYMPSASYETELLKSYSAGVEIFRSLGINLPLIVFMTLANAKGYRLGVGKTERFFRNEPIPFDRDVMMIPNVQVESFEQRDIDVLRPMIDIVWNAGGYECSLYYDENNNLIQTR